MMIKRLIAGVCTAAVTVSMAGIAELPGAVAPFVSRAASITAGALTYEREGDFYFSAVDENSIVINNYVGSDFDVMIPDEINGKVVAAIGERAFANNGIIQEVTIPDGVTYIAKEAFSGCSKLGSVDLPEGLEYIGEAAFESCAALKKIDIPDSVKDIGEAAFLSCEGLVSARLSENLGYINAHTFRNCSRLKSIVIPSNVKWIGDNAFECCNSLESVELNSGLKKIGDYAFRWSTSLKNFTIPETVTYIGQEAFFETAVTSITIPDSVTELGADAFQYCYYLHDVTLPAGLETISYSLFNGCRSLSVIDIPDSVKKIGGLAFFGCRSLFSVTVPDSVSEIEDHAFGFYGYIDDNEEERTAKIKGLCLNCSAGSEAERYAKEFGIDYDNGTGSERTDIASADIVLKTTKVTYTGKNVVPKITVLFDGKMLVKGTDYKLVGNRHNCYPGRAEVDIVGIGRYKGAQKFVYYIVPKKPAKVSVKSTSKKLLSVSWSKSLYADGYQIQVSRYEDFRKLGKSALTDRTSYKFSGLTSGRTYYVRIRPYISADGKKRTGAFSTVKKIKVK